MDERFRKQVKHFLAGTLDKKATLAVLDRVKESEECRLYLEEQARLASSRHRPNYATQTGAALGHYGQRTAAGKSFEDVARGSNHDFTSLLRPRRGMSMRRMMIFGGLVAAALFMFNNRNGAQATRPPLKPQEILVADAIAEGSPIATSPRGILTARPITISGYLPPGNQSLRIVFLAAGGRPVHEQNFTAGDSGVQMDPASIPGLEGNLPAVEFLVPFPNRKKLPLEKGKRYFYFLEIPNGRQSAPQPIDVR